MLEHLKTREEYTLAASNVRNIAKSIGVTFC
jgi:hypothetical protein